MKTISKWTVLVCAAAPWIAALGASAPSTNTGAATRSLFGDLFTNSVVAKGKGISISRNQLDQEIIRVKTQYAAQGSQPPPDVDRDVLDRMIKTQLILNRATESDRTNAKAQFNATLVTVKTRAKLTDEEYNQRLEQQLKMLNMTKEEWDKLNIEQQEIPLILERELKVDISNEEAKKFYDEHGASFETPEMVRAAHILVLTRDANTGAELSEELKAAKKKQAEDILKRARTGEDFGDLAKKYSDDSSSKDNGGELKIARGQLPNAPDFEKAVFALNTNQVSDVVSSPFGFHIIKLYEKIPAKKEPFNGPSTKTAMLKQDGENVTVKEYLAAQAIQKQLVDYLKKLWKEAAVEVLDVRLKIDEAPDMPIIPSSATNRPAMPGGK